MKLHYVYLFLFALYCEESVTASDQTEGPADKTEGPADKTEGPADKTKAPPDQNEGTQDSVTQDPYVSTEARWVGLPLSE